jgi:hypothetical protein
VEPRQQGRTNQPAEQDAERASSTAKEHDMTDLPEGWVPLSRFDSKDRGRTEGHSPEYKQLVAAVKDGELRGLQDPKSRRYYVPQEDAARLLVSKSAKAEKPSPPKDSPLEEVCDSLKSIDGWLHQICSMLERLANAAESIATQPKKDEFSDFVSH